jgi:hypothetical protein
VSLTNLEFYAIVPKEATNLVTNPSFELGTTGYTLLQSALARVTSQQRRGAAAMSITPNTGVAAGAYYAISLTNGTQYSFGADVLDVAGQTFNLYIADNAGTRVSDNVTWTGNGRWKRRTVTYTAAATATHRLYVTRSAVASTTVFYTDGWQLETGAASSYLDGDLKGFVRTQTDYFWNGSAHASTSWRSGQTRSGGTEVRLKDYLRIIAVLGLGLAPINNLALANARGGEFFQASQFEGRTISLQGKITGLDAGTIFDARKALTAALNPKLTGADQPMVLRIRGLDAVGGVEQAETVDAVVQYAGGLEGSWTGPGIEDAPLQFRMFLPFLTSEGEKASAITINQSVANADYALKMDRSGAWASVNTAFNGSVSALALGNDGSVYVGGAFTDVGDANGDYILRVNPDGTLTSLGTGMNGIVRCLAVAANGDLYAGGEFTLAGGVANTARIARWNGSAWNAIGTGIASGSVMALAFDTFGILYVGGTFTNHFDANGDLITKWNGSAWSSLGTGFAGIGAQTNGLIVGPDNTLYATGKITTAGGVTVNGITAWDGSAWSALGSGLSGGLNVGLALALDSGGNLYIGGDFNSIGGVAANNIAKWNGTMWSPLGDGMNNAVYRISFDDSGMIYASGFFSASESVPIPGRLAIWNGSSWGGMPILLPGTPTINAVLNARGIWYLGYDTSGSATAPLITAVINSGDAPAAPKITFTGPGTVYQVKNTTTGKAIYFNLTLLAGETAVLDLNPENPTFTSSFRGSLMNTILPGSNLDWRLLPGSNNLSIFVAGTTTAATTITVTWREQYAGLEGTR